MTDNATVIRDTALRAAPPAELEPGRYYAFHTPEGVHEIDLTGDEFKDAPSLKRGLVTVHDADSFLAYWDKHHDTSSEVYADARALSVTAVLDAHHAGAARWGAHRLCLRLRVTDTWQQWRDADGRLMEQEEFAEFLEDHLAELLDPDAATMLEVAQSIQASTRADFKSATRLTSGERQFRFEETVTGRAGQHGELAIPETFVVGVQPFDGSDGYRLTARLRYRMPGGRLKIGYKLQGPDKALEDAFAVVTGRIGDHIEPPVMNGSPLPAQLSI